MSTDIVQVQSDRVTLALGRFRLGLVQNESLMQTIGAGQLVSVRRTFREQGVPANSWAPLSPNTIARNPKKYGSGHKILIDSEKLLESITSRPTRGSVSIGTNLIYARVQQLGSADRQGAAIGPQARLAGRSIRVGRHSTKHLRAIQYKRVEVEGRDGTKYKVPRPVVKGDTKDFDLRGRRTRDALLQGPRQEQAVEVREHERFQNIPPRPYLVIRPEDPARIRRQVVTYIRAVGRTAGLPATEGA